MSVWQLESNHVRLEISSEGGFLYPAEFRLEGERIVSPLHRAPWLEEAIPDDLPPMLRGLRGDFFCAPFGDSDLLPEEPRPHGATANAAWTLVSSDDSQLELELQPSVMDARVTKRVFVRQGHAVIYQQHRFRGGSGALPVGHHAMLHTTEPLLLGFSNWVWGGTPPQVLEPDPATGRSSLAYPQRFSDLREVRLENGETTDLTTYPQLEHSEDLVMLVADSTLPFAWSAATNQHSGWVWFALKNPRVLCSTVLWLSNGGRDSAPWSGRHTGVIGIEEVSAYFHLGHRASVEANPLATQGIETALELRPDDEVSIRYAFGVAAIPDGFGRVVRIRAVAGGIALEDEVGQSVYAAVDLGFITEETV